RRVWGGGRARTGRPGGGVGDPRFDPGAVPESDRARGSGSGSVGSRPRRPRGRQAGWRGASSPASTRTFSIGSMRLLMFAAVVEETRESARALIPFLPPTDTRLPSHHGHAGQAGQGMIGPPTPRGVLRTRAGRSKAARSPTDTRLPSRHGHAGQAGQGMIGPPIPCGVLRARAGRLQVARPSIGKDADPAPSCVPVGAADAG